MLTIERKTTHPLIALLGLAFCGFASALPITAIDTALGPGTITRDAVSQRDWLDLTLTQGESYNDVQLDITPGGRFEGFRHALLEEIETFLNDSGITLPSFFPNVPNAPQIVDTIGLLGETFSDKSPASLACGVYESGMAAGPFGTAHYTACLVSSPAGGQWVPNYELQNDALRGRLLNGNIETCEHCGGAVKVIASIEDPIAIKKILAHLDRRSRLPVQTLDTSWYNNPLRATVPQIPR